MSYLSPFILFESIDHAPTPKEISQIKKRLMAEIDLSDELQIVMNNYLLDKSLIVKLVEELEVPEKLRLHYEIFKLDGLISFLHVEELPPSSSTNVFEEDQALKIFLKPYITEAYDQWMSTCISQNDPSLLKELVDHEIYHLVDHGGRFLETENLLHEYIDFLETQKAQVTKYAPMEGDLHPYYNENLIKLLNLLPGDLSRYKDLYGQKLLDLFVIVAEKQAKPFLAKNLLNAAAKLDTSEVLDANVKHYLNQVSEFEEKQENRLSFSGILGLIAIAITMLIKCNS